MSGVRTQERIELHDSWGTIIVKLSDGNPGAIAALTEILRLGNGYDLATPLKFLQCFLALDSAAIFGERIHVLYKDLCGGELLKMLTVLRALDVGLITAARLHLEMTEAMQGTGGALAHDVLLAGLQARWPNFGKESEK